jgi:hypothetical protein
LSDLALYFGILALAGLVFIPIHIVFIRFMSGEKLLTTFNSAVGFSILIASTLGWVFLGPHFSSSGAALVAVVGGAISFTGLAGVYGLILPVSVDRSVSSHIVGLVYLAPEHRLTEKALFELYTHDDLLRKRFVDCLATGIIKRDGPDILLTPHGARIARIYLWVGRVLGMRLWHLDRLRTGKSPF